MASQKGKSRVSERTRIYLPTRYLPSRSPTQVGQPVVRERAIDILYPDSDKMPVGPKLRLWSEVAGLANENSEKEKHSTARKRDTTKKDEDLLPHPDQIKSPRPSRHRDAPLPRSALKTKVPTTESQTPTKSCRVMFSPVESRCIITSKPYTPTTPPREYWIHCLYRAGVEFKSHKKKVEPEATDRPIDDEEKELNFQLVEARSHSDELQKLSPQYLDKEYWKRRKSWRENKHKMRNPEKDQTQLPRQKVNELVSWMRKWARRYEPSHTAEVPAGWKRDVDAHCRVFYENCETGEKSWVLPLKPEKAWNPQEHPQCQTALLTDDSDVGEAQTTQDIRSSSQQSPLRGAVTDPKPDNDAPERSPIPLRQDVSGVGHSCSDIR